MKKHIVLVFILIFLFKNNCNSQNNNPISKKNPTEYYGMKFPLPIGYVNDYSKIFNAEQISKLERTITLFEKKTTNEIVIVTIDSIAPYKNIHLFSTELANNWGVGKKKFNNGLAIVLCKNLRQISIATGYGTEKKLDDYSCKKVIDSIIIPEFKKGDYYGGIKNGLEELIFLWEK